MRGLGGPSTPLAVCCVRCSLPRYSHARFAPWLPQDVEGVIDADGKVTVVQTRPQM